MENAKRIFWNILLFISNPDYQDKQSWVQRLIKTISPSPLAHQHVLTGSRIPGGVLTILSYELNPYFGVLVFLMFALTDWADGKVARYKGENNGGFGAAFDAFSDKCFAIPILWYFGTKFSPNLFFISIILIEFFGYLIVFYCKKGQEDIFEHLLVGKYKFGLQIAAILMLFLANQYSPEWMWWPLFFNILFSTINVLAFFSVACKLDVNFIRFLPDFISAGNLISGIYSTILAGSNTKYACTLIVLGAAFDFFDGMMARKLRKTASSIGKIIDSVSDWVTFGIAPSYLVYQIGVPWWAALFYLVATSSRLVYYSTRPGKEGVFDGFPSTAAAILIACLSFFYQGIYLTEFVVFLGFFEIFFHLNWYHFKKFSKVPVKKRNGLLVVYGLGIITLGLPQSTFIFMLVYMALFYKPVADEIFFKE